MTQINIWYTADEPRNLPCWKVNPKLWEIFLKLRQQYDLPTLSNKDYFTEDYVVQTIDLELNIAKFKRTIK
jgi:hypothetical protein